MAVSIKKFQNIIWKHYREHGRDFAWRRTRDPYKILVSEIMLQQTQTSRVEVKYASFLKKFPTTKALAAAKLQDVLVEWQGLGYNRRALFLKRCAERIEREYAGKFPRDFKTLCSLPGIGPATAGDIMAFAWNMPVPVIETNIRSVYIHYFFKDCTEKISDKEILPLVEKTLDRENPREWYWALFDQGAYLKATLRKGKDASGNPSRRSAHHVKQSRFEGSYRQKRAAVLRTVLKKSQTVSEIQKELTYKPADISQILTDLEQDGFIKKVRAQYVIA